MDRDNQDAAALRDYGDEDPSAVALPKYASKQYSKDVGVTGKGDITSVQANGDDLSHGKKVSIDEVHPVCGIRDALIRDEFGN